MSNILQINKCDIANGPGCRVTVFIAGCSRHCKGCFNPESHDYNAGEPFTTDKLLEILEAGEKSYIKGLTILGGEPLDHYNWNLLTTLGICSLFKAKFPSKSVWVYTGYKFEDFKPEEIKAFSKYIDVLVDGEFIEEQKDLSLKFRGSKNQRLINLKETVSQKEIVLIDD